MDLYGQKSTSIPQKVLIHLLELVFIWISWWVLFGSGTIWVAEHLNIRVAGGNPGRRVIIFIFNIIVFLRIAYTMFFLIRRKIPWEESVSVPVAFALYYVGFSLFVLPCAKPFGWPDILGILLFVTGSVLNTGGELLRDRWKKKPENKGRIYTGGFFQVFKAH